jgi:hypothetical protein
LGPFQVEILHNRRVGARQELARSAGRGTARTCAARRRDVSGRWDSRSDATPGATRERSVDAFRGRGGGDARLRGRGAWALPADAAPGIRPAVRRPPPLEFERAGSGPRRIQGIGNRSSSVPMLRGSAPVLGHGSRSEPEPLALLAGITTGVRFAGVIQFAQVFRWPAHGVPGAPGRHAMTAV